MNKQPQGEPNFYLGIEGASIEKAQLGQAGRDLHQIQYVTVYDTLNFAGLFRTSVKPPTTQEEYRFRQVLLNKVKQYWVRDVLEKSLHSKTPIELGLQERADAIAHPFSSVVEIPAPSKQNLPQGTSVTDVFNQMGEGRTLLILGKPGAGKTTILLKLVQNLIARAEETLSQRIPVVFNLSSWGNKKQPIADWLVRELYSKYGVSQSLAKTWVKQQQLLLMLDGLDEVKNEYRQACVRALNQFMQNYGQTEMVVCSRIQDYQALSVPLTLRGAICVLPLNNQQIERYLKGLGDRTLAVQILLQKDTALQELASSPLILSIMTLAYGDISVRDLPQLNSIKQRRQHLFNTYIQRMFERRSDREDRTEAVTRLIWLARQMLQSSQTVFLIERMQPTCLENNVQKFLYRLGSFLIGTFAFGLVVWSIYPDDLKSLWLTVLVVTFNLILGMGEIETVETLKWSWQEAKNNAIAGLIGGLILGMPIGLLLPVENQLNLGLVYGLCGGLIFGLISGLKGPEIKTKMFANQGIWSSAKNAAIIGSIGGILGALLGFSVQPDWLKLGLIYGGILGTMLGGGKACIQHFTLRLILYLKGSIPWNYARFLDAQCDRIFLQQVGGGYIFIHRMLLEHFAEIGL
jgi:GTPase SAR1 family protein